MTTSWLPTGRLGGQIAIAFVGFGVALTLGLGLSLVSGLESVEESILDDAMHDELAYFRDQVETGSAPGSYYSRTTTIYAVPPGSPGEIPAYLGELGAGIHHLQHEGRELRVLVEDLDGVRYTIEFDEADILARQAEFVRWVWASTMIVLLVGCGVGLWIARRLSKPTRNLADQIVRLENDRSATLDVSGFADDEIGLLARSLKRYHEQLNDLLVREKEFAGNVSHELRTPVTNIGLAAEVLAAKPDLSAKELETISRIERSTREMTALIDTFLLLARVDDTPVQEYSGCDLRPVVDEVVAQQRVWLGSKPVEIEIVDKAEIQVAAPPRVLYVLIANLVRNSFRYTNTGRVTIVLDEQHVTVEDTGTGIEPQIRNKLFERHTRGDANGSGLGLSIVRRICDRYGWQVSFDSVPSEGSWFRIDFGGASGPVEAAP